MKPRGTHQREIAPLEDERMLLAMTVKGECNNRALSRRPAAVPVSNGRGSDETIFVLASQFISVQHDGEWAIVVDLDQHHGPEFA
jgi:hypothetical protein